MPSPNDLLKAIDELVEQKTFGLDALDGIKSLRDKAATLAAMLEASQETVGEHSSKIVELNSKLADAQREAKGWQERETALVKREVEITKLERDTAVAQAALAATQSTMSAFLRNTIVRENVTKNIPVASGGNNYPITMAGSEFTTREEE